MDFGQLQLNRLVVANYKSIRRVEFVRPGNLCVLMGRNNAGKSNLLDALVFLSDASRNLPDALAAHGGDLAAIMHKKRDTDPVDITLEFQVGEDLRNELLAKLFSNNRQMTARQAAQTQFLRSVTLRVQLAPGRIIEELSAVNFTLTGRACILFQAKAGPGMVEYATGQVEMLCERQAGDLPHEVIAFHSGAVREAESRLCLGHPPGAAAYPISAQLAELVSGQLTTLQWVDPGRQLNARVPIAGEMELAPNAANLPDVLHWLHNNRPKHFKRIEAEVGRLVPELGRLYTPTFQNHTTLGMLEDEESDLAFTMEQISYGTKSAIAIITKVVLARPGMWLCIEEPETHLHPQAQVQLFRFLAEESKDKRIFVATHSTAIAAATPLDSLLLVGRDLDHCTMAARVTPADAHRVIDELGVHPSYNFAADAVVLVEEAEDVPIYEAWMKRHPQPLNVQFLEADGGNTLRCLANLRVASSPRVHTLVYLLLGSGTPIPGPMHSLHEHLVNELHLPSDHIIELEARAPHAYLFSVPALQKVFPQLATPMSDLGQRVSRAAAEPDPRAAFRGLLRELRLPNGDGLAPARVAQALESLPTQITGLLEHVEQQAGAYQSV